LQFPRSTLFIIYPVVYRVALQIDNALCVDQGRALFFSVSFVRPSCSHVYVLWSPCPGLSCRIGSLLSLPVNQARTQLCDNSCFAYLFPKNYFDGGRRNRGTSLGMKFWFQQHRYESAQTHGLNSGIPVYLRILSYLTSVFFIQIRAHHTKTD
jgi:hypothetical protein